MLPSRSSDLVLLAHLSFVLLGVAAGRATAESMPSLLIMDTGSSIPVSETFEGQIVQIRINPDGTPGAPSIYVSQQEVIDTGVPVPPDDGTPLTVRYTENGMVFDELGDLYFSESARDAIFVKRALGGPLEVLSTELDIIEITGGLEAKPEYVAAAPGNRLFFTERDSDSIMEVNTVSGDLTIVATESDFETALSDVLGVPVTDLDLESGLVHLDGALYVADGANAAVFAVDVDTGAISVLATSDDFEPFQPNVIQPPVQLDGFLTMDANGDLLIVDDYDSIVDFQILRVDRLGGGVSMFLTQGQLEAADATGDNGVVNLDGGIVFDLEGNFYVGQEDGDTVLRFPLDPAGTTGVDVLGDAGFEFLDLDDILGGDRDGEIQASVILVPPDPTSVHELAGPRTYSVLPATPNPFNPHTRIGFTLPETGHVRIDVFEARGRRVTRWIDRVYPAGVHRVEFDADQLASGTYFYRVTLPGLEETHKMTLIP